MGGLFGGSLSGADDRVALQFLIIGLEGVGQTLSVIFQRWPLPFPVSGGWPIRDGKTFTGLAKSPDPGGSLADQGGQRKGLFGGFFLEASGRRACPAPPFERELVPRSHARARSGRAVCRGLAHSTTDWPEAGRRTTREGGSQPSEFAPFGEGHDLAALYRSRQARYLRADYDKDLTRRRDRAELDPAL